MEIAHLVEMLRRWMQIDSKYGPEDRGAFYSSSVSSTMVNGPSFTSETLMSAPKLPV